MNPVPAGLATAASELPEPLPRVLVCDDSPSLCEFVRTILGNAYECVLTDSAERALEQLDTFRPDVLISDLRMSGMDGIELCRRVRAHPVHQNISVILVTAQADISGKVAGLESGADDYLFKPLQPRELLARVRSLARLRRATLEVAERNQQLEALYLDLQRAQEALVQSEKLSTMGTLAAGVAHEINNPLAFVKSGVHSLEGYTAELAQLLKALLPHAPATEREAWARTSEDCTTEMREVLQEVNEGLVRIERIVGDLRQASSADREVDEAVDVRAEVEHAWKLVAARGAGRVTLECSIEGQPTIRGTPRLLGQVLVNLFLNALQAIPGKGWLRVTGGVEGDHLRLQVEDSGPGIRPEHVGRVFDPFFTTKPPGDGTGMGLSVSASIVNRLGGALRVSSPEGHGACFTLELPVSVSSKVDAYNRERSSTPRSANPASVG